MWKYLLFIGLPALEIVLLAWIGGQIGFLGTFLLVIVTGVIGARLVAAQGRVVWMSFRTRLATGDVPDVEIAHGAMLLVAGAVLLTPGVITDAIGFLLLSQTVRELIRVRFLETMRIIIA
jgi:UPF0716 protein FxsA